MSSWADEAREMQCMCADICANIKDNISRADKWRISTQCAGFISPKQINAKINTLVQIKLPIYIATTTPRMHFKAGETTAESQDAVEHTSNENFLFNGKHLSQSDKLQFTRSENHHSQEQQAMAPALDISCAIGSLSVSNGHIGDLQVQFVRPK